MTHTIQNVPSKLIGLLYAKAILRFRNGALDAPLPDINLTQSHFSISTNHLRGYRELCGFGYYDEFPITYLFVLGLRPQLALVTNNRFPFRVAGMVHTACAIRLFQDMDTAAPFDLSIALKSGAPVVSGREIVFHIEATQRGCHTAECRAAFRVHGLTKKARGSKPKETVPMYGAPDRAIEFMANVGRLYAYLSGDYNPIHLSPLLARAFRFRTAIAHGMYLAARVLVFAREQCAGPIRAMDVSFQRPVPLPSVGLLRFKRQDNGTLDFQMTRKADGSIALSGRCESV